MSVCGGVWPSRSAFARAMGIKASLFQAYITAWDSADENEIALAVLAAQAGILAVGGLKLYWLWLAGR